MSEKRRSGRKKHIVEGNVTQVKRGSEGLGTHERVGEGGFMSVIRKLFKGSKK